MIPMSPQDREQCRLSLLRFLCMVPGRALGEAVLRQMLGAEQGRLPQQDEVRAELTYLEDKGLVEQPHKLISPEVRMYRATAAGRDQFAQITGS